MSRLLLAAVLAAAACSRPAPPAPAVKKLGAVLHDARYAGPCASVVAVEWPMSRAVPLSGTRPGRYKIFFYPLSGSPGKPPRLATPAAEAVVDVDAGAPVECRRVPGVPKDVAPPRWSPAASALSDEDFSAKSDELDRLTEDAAAAYSARRADADLARRYLADFELLAEPAYLGDYYRLNPDFWEWVRGAAGRSIPKPAA